MREIIRHDASETPSQKVEELLLKAETLVADDSLFFLNRFEQAGEAYKQAIAIQRKLEVSKEKLADTLYKYADLLNFIYFYEETGNADLLETLIPLYEECLDLHIVLVESNPNVYKPKFITILDNLSILHSRVGRHDIAEKECKELLEIYRTSAKENRDKYLPHVARILKNLGIMHSQSVVWYDEAEKEFREAFEIFRSLEIYPYYHIREIKDMLKRLSILYDKMKEAAE